MPLPIPGDGLEGVKDGFEPLPAGLYDVKVVDAEETETSGEGKTPKGTPMIKWEFEVTEDEYLGRKLWMNTVLSEKSLGVFKGVLRALGHDDDEMDAMKEYDPTEDIGAECRAVVAVGTNPKTKEKNNSVKRLRPLHDEDDAEDGDLPTG